MQPTNEVHCCIGQAISITYSECVFVAALHAPYCIVICGLSSSAMFSHIDS